MLVKLKTYAIVTLVTLLVVACVYIRLVGSELETLSLANSELLVELTALQQSLAMQNAFITELEQSQSQHKAELSAIDKKYRTQLLSLQQSSPKTCEEKLQHIAQAQKEFFYE